jgi:hypothetical protein
MTFRLLASLFAVAALASCAGGATRSASSPGPGYSAPSIDELRAGPGGDDLARATEALARFRDPEVALHEGYVRPGNNDGFEMGEHWWLPELMRNPTCDLERPTFLQYLVIDGRRELIGTGYVCDAQSGPPAWFGNTAVWHEHGPALCRWKQAATIDAQPFANTLPNPENNRSWQELCDAWWGEPVERKIVMLHTWNWIPAPDGPLVHENRAIPFLRAGLRVPTKNELDSPVGRDALAALRLAQGDAGGRYAGGFLVADFGFFEWIRFGKVLKHGRKRGEAALDAMRDAERRDDRVAYAAAAAEGAAALAQMQTEVEARLSQPQRDVVDRFLAELTVHDHHDHHHVE